MILNSSNLSEILKKVSGLFVVLLWFEEKSLFQVSFFFYSENMEDSVGSTFLKIIGSPFKDFFLIE